MESRHCLIVLCLALIAPRCDSLDCLYCESYTYLDADFTDIASEDRDCVAGTNTPEYLIQCRQEAFCAVIEGTVTWFVAGYGFVDAKMTIRNCVILSGTSFPTNGCFDSHSTYSFLHQLIGDKFTDRELTNFNGTFCGCNHANTCNNSPGSVPEITRGHIPKNNPRGLQCVSCYHQVFQDPGFESLDETNPSCREAAINEDNVYYHTCAKGGVCGVIDGEVNYFDVSINYFARDCMYGVTDYTATLREDGMLCVSSQNVSQIVTTHLFSESEALSSDFSGELCYCTTDFCALPYKVYTTPSNVPQTPENHSDINVIHTGMLMLCNLSILVFIR